MKVLNSILRGVKIFFGIVGFLLLALLSLVMAIIWMVIDWLFIRGTFKK